jgi:hypothetical protein
LDQSEWRTALVHLDVQQLEQVVLQAVAVGVGADELAHGAGAVDGLHDDAQVVAQRRQVEAGEVEDLEHARVLHQALQARRARSGRAGRVQRLPRDLDDGGAPRPVAELDQAEPVADVDEAERLGVHGHRVALQVGLELLFAQVPLHDLGRDVRRWLEHRRGIIARRAGSGPRAACDDGSWAG